MLPVNSGGHAAYQNFRFKNLRKYYPDPSSIPASTWDMIERFRTLDLTYTDELLRQKYGYAYESSTDFAHITDHILKAEADLVLLDINLPYQDGYSSKSVFLLVRTIIGISDCFRISRHIVIFRLWS